MRVEGIGRTRVLPQRPAPVFSRQVYEPIACPKCFAERPHVETVRLLTRYYTCRECGTPFKVEVRRRS